MSDRFFYRWIEEVSFHVWLIYKYLLSVAVLSIHGKVALYSCSIVRPILWCACIISSPSTQPWLFICHVPIWWGHTYMYMPNYLDDICHAGCSYCVLWPSYENYWFSEMMATALVSPIWARLKTTNIVDASFLEVYGLTSFTMVITPNINWWCLW